MREHQSVLEMAQEVLTRQAMALVSQTGQTFENACAAVASTDAGHQLRQLASSERRHEKAAEWQASLPLTRAEERHYYSRLEGYMEWLEGEEHRVEYHALLEELASLRG